LDRSVCLGFISSIFESKKFTQMHNYQFLYVPVHVSPNGLAWSTKHVPMKWTQGTFLKAGLPNLRHQGDIISY